MRCRSVYLVLHRKKHLPSPNWNRRKIIPNSSQHWCMHIWKRNFLPNRNRRTRVRRKLRNPFVLQYFLPLHWNSWLHSYSFSELFDGFDCYGKTSISLHVSFDQLYSISKWLQKTTTRRSTSLLRFQRYCQKMWLQTFIRFLAQVGFRWRSPRKNHWWREKIRSPFYWFLTLTWHTQSIFCVQINLQRLIFGLKIDGT